MIGLGDEIDWAALYEDWFINQLAETGIEDVMRVDVKPEFLPAIKVINLLHAMGYINDSGRFNNTYQPKKDRYFCNVHFYREVRYFLSKMLGYVPQ